MQKILFPISEKEYLVCQKRMAQLIKAMASEFTVDALTTSEEVFDDLKTKLEGCKNAEVRYLKETFLPLTFDFRDNVSKIFVKYTEDIYIPGTDLKIWKTAAFDDLWGHISACAFPEIKTIDADLVLLPLQSWEDLPLETTDVLNTTLTLMAKEAGKKVIGYQLYPVFNAFKLMPRLMDGIIVKEEFEKQFYCDMGISSEIIHCLSDQKDIYSLSTIEESYKDHLYNQDIEIKRDELSIVVLNHSKLRPQIIDMLKVIQESKVPVVLSMVKRDFFVKDITEDDIIEGLYFSDIRKIGCRFYLVDSTSLVPMTMISDIVLSPTYVTPIEFAARYNKHAWVYNPCEKARDPVKGVHFMNHPKDLSTALKSVHRDKKKTIRINDILRHIVRKG